MDKSGFDSIQQIKNLPDNYWSFNSEKTDSGSKLLLGAINLTDGIMAQAKDKLTEVKRGRVLPIANGTLNLIGENTLDHEVAIIFPIFEEKFTGVGEFDILSGSRPNIVDGYIFFLDKPNKTGYAIKIMDTNSGNRIFSLHKLAALENTPGLYQESKLIQFCIRGIDKVLNWYKPKEDFTRFGNNLVFSKSFKIGSVTKHPEIPVVGLTSDLLY